MTEIERLQQFQRDTAANYQAGDRRALVVLGMSDALAEEILITHQPPTKKEPPLYHFEWNHVYTDNNCKQALRPESVAFSAISHYTDFGNDIHVAILGHRSERVYISGADNCARFRAEYRAWSQRRGDLDGARLNSLRKQEALSGIRYPSQIQFDKDFTINPAELIGLRDIATEPEPAQHRTDHWTTCPVCRDGFNAARYFAENCIVPADARATVQHPSAEDMRRLHMAGLESNKETAEASPNA